MKIKMSVSFSFLLCVSALLYYSFCDSLLQMSRCFTVPSSWASLFRLVTILILSRRQDSKFHVCQVDFINISFPLMFRFAVCLLFFLLRCFTYASFSVWQYVAAILFFFIIFDGSVRSSSLHISIAYVLHSSIFQCFVPFCMSVLQGMCFGASCIWVTCCFGVSLTRVVGLR